jgi:hypothetical protein
MCHDIHACPERALRIRSRIANLQKRRYCDGEYRAHGETVHIHDLARNNNVDDRDLSRLIIQ